MRHGLQNETGAKWSDRGVSAAMFPTLNALSLRTRIKFCRTNRLKIGCGEQRPLQSTLKSTANWGFTPSKSMRCVLLTNEFAGLLTLLMSSARRRTKLGFNVPRFATQRVGHGFAWWDEGTMFSTGILRTTVLWKCRGSNRTTSKLGPTGLSRCSNLLAVSFSLMTPYNFISRPRRMKCTLFLWASTMPHLTQLLWMKKKTRLFRRLMQMPI
mmetsp:Transcript_21409/g.67185  ORF Transcript_21409/g.67185 Transcript_21409/m.67185 type:complete len:212 (-) Transcript_21409:4547-5182(-)